MSLMDRLTGPSQVVETLSNLTEAQVEQYVAELENANFQIEELRESLADVELMLEDRGWVQLSAWADRQFSRDGIVRAAHVCRAMSVANPLLRRGLSLRSTYIWSGGVTMGAKAKGGDDGEQDVNAVVQDFLDDKATRKSLSGAQAQAANERTLGTDGNLFAALFTAPRTGRVQPRLLPLEEMAAVVKNPDDRSEPWFYQRVSVGADGGQRITYHPDIDYQPAVRVTRFTGDQTIGTQQLLAGDVLWDAPVVHLKVNALHTWDFGIGDAFTSVSFARMYQEFLVDWAKLVKALSRFAWRISASRKGAAEKAGQRVNARTQVDGSSVGGPSGVGQAAAMVGANLEAIPKTGATIDADAGRPIAAMVAAGMDVPVTMLLGDPGVTGARATAETLDTPTEGMASQRQQAWSEFYRSILDYVIDAAVRAPQGALSGTVNRDEWGRSVVTLDGDTERTIDVDWADPSDTPIDLLMQAIKDADDIDKLPPLLIVRLMLSAFNVEDADEWIKQVTDERGEFKNPNPRPPSPAGVGSDAVDAFNQGEDPAALLGHG